MPSIRLLDRSDAPAYQALRLLALRESPAAFSASEAEESGWSIDEVAERLAPAQDGSVRMFGLLENEMLCACVALLHPQRCKLRHGAELAGLYVAPTRRRCGHASALLTAAIDHARGLDGVRQIKLGVSADNLAAKALYYSMGFERYGIEPDALQIDGVFHDQEHSMLRWSWRAPA